MKLSAKYVCLDIWKTYFPLASGMHTYGTSTSFERRGEATGCYNLIQVFILTALQGLLYFEINNSAYIFI